MKNGMSKAWVVAGLFTAVGSAQADGIGIGARYSTLGVGVELGKSFTDFFTARVGLNKYSISDTQNIDDIQYNTDLDLQSASLLLDWHPLGGSFHFTAGYLNNGSEMNAIAPPTGSFDIGGTTYDS
ncbi:MAG: hypothetical protein ABFS08_08050 [Pseudomonadota bacterium]